MRWKKKHKWAVLMSFRGSGGHLFVCTGFHKQCAVNHLRWRVSASQRRVQPTLNTEDGCGTILLWLFRLIATHTHTHPKWHTAADVWYYCGAPAVSVQRLLSNHLSTASQNEGVGERGRRGEGCENFSMWQQSGKLKTGLLWSIHLDQCVDQLDNNPVTLIENLLLF